MERTTPITTQGQIDARQLEAMAAQAATRIIPGAGTSYQSAVGTVFASRTDVEGIPETELLTVRSIAGSPEVSASLLEFGSGFLVTDQGDETAQVTFTGGGSSVFSGAKVTILASQSVTNGAFTKLTWDTVRYDTSSYFSAANNHFVIPQTGYYAGMVNVITGNNGTGSRTILISSSLENLASGAVSMDGVNSLDLSIPYEGHFTAGTTISAHYRFSSTNNGFAPAVTKRTFTIHRLG